MLRTLRFFLLPCLLPCLLLASGVAGAHHAVSMVYVPDRMVSVSGVVEEFRFHNPHCVIFMTETNAAGEQRRWTIEWAGASALRHQGLTAQLLKPGDAITATGFPARDGSAGMALQVIEFADGRPAIRPPDRSGAGEQ
jgi:hypothetical protein